LVGSPRPQASERRAPPTAVLMRFGIRDVFGLEME
jgi:hypothetical protein